MSKTCFLFPGQGAQYPGMGKDLYESFSEVRTIFELASDVTHIDLKELLFTGTEAELKKTDNTQAAITLVNLSAAAALHQKGITPDSCAGFSLGEFSALYTAGIISLEDTFRIAKARGDFMQKACDGLAVDGKAPGMAAVMGLSIEAIEEQLTKSDIELFIANINSPVQTVVAGTAKGIEDGEALLKGAGAKRYIPLKVAGPFHSPLMESAKNEFSEFIKNIEYSDPVLPCYSNVTGKKISSAAEAKQLSIEQIVSPVQWVKEETAIISDGTAQCFEAGPGRVLSGLWRSVTNEIPCRTAGTIEDLNEIKGDMYVA